MPGHELSVPRVAWSVDEVAAATGLPRRQVYDVVHSGALPAIRVGRHWRISDLALRTWLDGDTARVAS